MACEITVGVGLSSRLTVICMTNAKTIKKRFETRIISNIESFFWVLNKSISLHFVNTLQAFCLSYCLSFRNHLCIAAAAYSPSFFLPFCPLIRVFWLACEKKSEKKKKRNEKKMLRSASKMPDTCLAFQELAPPALFLSKWMAFFGQKIKLSNYTFCTITTKEMIIQCENTDKYVFSMYFGALWKSGQHD